MTRRSRPILRLGPWSRAASRFALSACLAASFATWPSVLDAQSREQGRRAAELRRVSEQRQMVEERLRRSFARRIQEELGLTDEAGERLSEVVGAFAQVRAELLRDERGLRAGVDSLLAEDDEDGALTFLDELAALRLRETELLRAEQTSLLEVLTPVQVLRYLLLREELGSRIRRLRTRLPPTGMR